jgi:hypothetical protein
MKKKQLLLRGMKFEISAQTSSHFFKSHPSYFKKIGDGPINMALSK